MRTHACVDVAAFDARRRPSHRTRCVLQVHGGVGMPVCWEITYITHSMRSVLDNALLVYCVGTRGRNARAPKSGIQFIDFQLFIFINIHFEGSV